MVGVGYRFQLQGNKLIVAAGYSHPVEVVIPEDIKEMAPHVLRHRIMLAPEKEMEGITPDNLVESILRSVEIPR